MRDAQCIWLVGAQGITGARERAGKAAVDLGLPGEPFGLLSLVETLAQVSQEPPWKWKLALQRGGERVVGTRRLRVRSQCFGGRVMLWLEDTQICGRKRKTQRCNPTSVNSGNWESSGATREIKWKE